MTHVLWSVQVLHKCLGLEFRGQHTSHKIWIFNHLKKAFRFVSNQLRLRSEHALWDKWMIYDYTILEHSLILWYYVIYLYYVFLTSNCINYHNRYNITVLSCIYSWWVRIVNSGIGERGATQEIFHTYKHKADLSLAPCPYC